MNKYSVGWCERIKCMLENTFMEPRNRMVYGEISFHIHGGTHSFLDKDASAFYLANSICLKIFMDEHSNSVRCKNLTDSWRNTFIFL